MFSLKPQLSFVNFLTLALLISGPAQTQTFEPEKPIAEIASSMEENLTWNLRNALSLYFPEKKFVIRANVDLRKVAPVVPKSPLPSLPDALLNKELKNLPGLPFDPENLPERSARAEDALRLYQQVQKNNYDVRKIRVNVLLDESLSESDRSFIQRYVSVIADINPGRGDQVRIESLSFPSRPDFPSEIATAGETDLKTAPLPGDLGTEKTATDWLPWAIAAAAALVLIAALVWGFRSLSKKIASHPEHATRAQPALSSQTATDSEVINWSDVTRKNETEAVRRLKSEAIDTIVGTPTTAAKVLQQWVDQKEQAGAREAAVVLAASSKPLLQLLAPYLGSETSHQIQTALDKVSDADVRENAGALLNKFDQDVRSLALQTRESAEEEDALAFLNQMTDDQLQHLLKPLKQGVQAIVLAQLRPNRSAKILSKMEPEARKAVLAAMGDIERIPVDVYQHVARQLANRATELEKMRYVRANGVDSLVKVLDYFDEDAQSDTLNYLQTQNIDLANKVSQKFMTFPQLLNSSKEKIREIALEVDRDMFAKSLVKVRDEEIVKIIQSLPTKLAELVEASLEANHDLSDHEVSQARRSLMRSIREKQAQRVA